MKTILSMTKYFWLAAIFLSLACVSAVAADDDLKLQAQLVLGTNDEKPKSSGLKPVAKDIEKKLKHLPLKWDHYYVQASKKFNLSADGTKKVSLSKTCQISVKNLGGSKVELTLVDSDKTVGKITQSLHKGQTLVAGAGAENSIVVLQQTD